MRFLILVVVTALALLPESASAADGHGTNHPAAADLKKFQVAPGLKVEIFAGEPLLENPVCFSIDERGRFYVVETHRYRNAIFDITANTPWLLDDLSFRTVNDRVNFLARTFATNSSVLTNDSELIRLVEDRNGDGLAETSSIFADGFNRPESGTAAGVLAQGTNVWFTSIPDLFRFQVSGFEFRAGAATTSSVAAERAHSKLETPNSKVINGLGVHISVSGHDVHGLIRGHDGRIYFSFGDRGVCVTNREGVVLNVPDSGGVLRCEPDGRNMEIFCIGLRNPQELAFDDYGNLWTVDNDTAGADPCRVLHLVEGGDYGWRGSYQHMKGFGPWVQEELWRGGLDGTLPPAGTVSQGPAGLAFYPGTSRTPQLAGKFVHADFPGGVWAYGVKPRGASFELADKEKILWNCWPTDVDFGPDGALYVLDWVQGWAPPGKGRIYRLTANDQSSMTKAQVEGARQTRQLLAGGMDNRTEKELLALLGHEDRRVRLKAQWELAGGGLPMLDALGRVAEQSKAPFQRYHALGAIGQIVRDISIYSSPPEINDAILIIIHLLDDKDRQVAARAAQGLRDAVSFEGKEALTPLLSDSEPSVRRVAGHALAEMPFGRGVRTMPRLADKVAARINRPWAHKLVAKWFARNSQWVGPMESARLLLQDHVSDPFMGHLARQVLQQGVTMGSYYDRLLVEASTNKSLALRQAALLAHRRLAERVSQQPVWPGYPHFRTNAESVSIQILNFLSSPEPSLVLNAARAINDVPIPGASRALAELLADSRFRDPDWGWSALSNATPAGPFSAKVRPPRDQVLLRALNARFRLGAADNAEELARFAAGASSANADAAAAEAGAPMPASLRAEALFLLGSWEVLLAKVGDLPIKPSKDPNHGSVPTVNPENWPGWFDRVVGLYRPLPPRGAAHAQQALAPRIAALLRDRETLVVEAAINAAMKLKLTNAAPVLLARLREAATPSVIREKIPAALAALSAAHLLQAIPLALADAEPAVRAAALPYLSELEGDNAVEILSRIVRGAVSGEGKSKPLPAAELRLAQAALDALGRNASPTADTPLREALTNLVAGRYSRAFELNLFEAIARRTGADVAALVKQHSPTVAADDEIAEWRTSLEGGDAARGRSLFIEKAEVQCSRCHQVKGEGGIVGPALDGIGKRQGRDYLLAAIVRPNKVIAPGFENVILTLKNGASPAGVVKSEDATSLRLESPEDGPMTITKSEIVERRRGLSAMPEGMDQQLTRRELRDLVEFLATLK